MWYYEDLYNFFEEKKDDAVCRDYLTDALVKVNDALDKKHDEEVEA